MAFKTQAEIYQALLDGKKIRKKWWNSTDHIYLPAPPKGIGE